LRIIHGRRISLRLEWVRRRRFCPALVHQFRSRVNSVLLSDQSKAAALFPPTDSQSPLNKRKKKRKENEDPNERMNYV
jgi:hypothetical protein